MMPNSLDPTRQGRYWTPIHTPTSYPCAISEIDQLQTSFFLISLSFKKYPYRITYYILKYEYIDNVYWYYLWNSFDSGDGEFVGWQGTDNSAKPLSVCVSCLSVIFICIFFPFDLFINFPITKYFNALYWNSLLLVLFFLFERMKEKSSSSLYWSTQTATLNWNCSFF